MKVEQLKALLSDKPFRLFVLETIGGNYITVEASDRVLFPPASLPELDLIFVVTSDRLVHHFTIKGSEIAGINSYAILPK